VIVVISDLHLQHLANDRVRYLKENQVHEASVLRNVSGEALELLFSEIHRAVDRFNVKEIELVFAGDIFEINRSPAWFDMRDPVRLRPTGPLDDALKQRVTDILDKIEDENAHFFQTLANFVANQTYGAATSLKQIANVTVTVSYVPGNHDRLVNAWPSTRATVRRLLAMSPDAAPFDHVIDRLADFRTRIIHGHEYDSYNFATTQSYDDPCFGDVITVDVAARLATSFRAYHHDLLRAPNETGAALRRLYLGLTEFDDFRPASNIETYLKGLAGESVAALLHRGLLDIFGTLQNEPLVTAQFTHLPGPIADFVAGVVGLLSPDHLLEAIGAAARYSDEPGDPARYARWERVRAPNLKYVVAGHTHRPDVVSLGDDTFYLDTGTWRTSLREGNGGIGRARAYTYVFCYSKAERSAQGDACAETWTGHLIGEKYGPKDEPLVEQLPAPGGPRKFLTAMLDGPESTSVRIAVDGQLTAFTIGELEPVPIPLDPRLDGEVTVVVDDKDWGITWLHREGAGFLNETFTAMVGGVTVLLTVA